MPEAHSKYSQYNNPHANKTRLLNATDKWKYEAETKTLERCKTISDEVLKETSQRIRLQRSPEAGDKVKPLRGNLRELAPRAAGVEISGAFGGRLNSTERADYSVWPRAQSWYSGGMLTLDGQPSITHCRSSVEVSRSEKDLTVMVAYGSNPDSGRGDRGISRRPPLAT